MPATIENNFNIILGKKIREIRKIREVSLNKLAEQMQVSYQQLQKYETGTNRISAEKLHEVAKFLEIDVICFFPGIAPDFLHNSDEKTLNALHRIKNPDIKNILAETIEKFAAL
jgi:transcriptional regulator with XRE-family HTH domain